MENVALEVAPQAVEVIVQQSAFAAAKSTVVDVVKANPVIAGAVMGITVTGVAFWGYKKFFGKTEAAPTVTATVAVQQPSQPAKA